MLLHSLQALAPSPGARDLSVLRPLVCGSLGEILKSCLPYLLGFETAFLIVCVCGGGVEGLNPAPPISSFWMAKGGGTASMSPVRC